MAEEKGVISFHNLSLPGLVIADLILDHGQSWCFYGGNRSGINTFFRLLNRELSPDSAKVTLPATSSVLSFARQQQIYEDELRKDDTNFINRLDPGTPAADFLPSQCLTDPLLDILNFRDVLSRGYRQLSSGQNRKLLLLQAIFSGASPIILDCPYDGLDRKSCQELDLALQQLAHRGILLLLLVRNQTDIPNWVSHLAFFSQGALICRGPYSEICGQLPQLTHEQHPLDLNQAGRTPCQQPWENPKELIRLQQGFAGYGGKLLFSGLDLIIRPGDHTLVTGPNGCGKSTLLHILTGDHPQCYVNSLFLFGRRRGSGESIWDLKKHMGIVSPELHRNYRAPGTALHVVLSGFYDSIGLYHKPTDHEIREGRKWLAMLNLAKKETIQFRRLEYGEQRLVLIARALIKSPPLLILDEPTQGLGQEERQALLDFLEYLSVGTQSTIVYVSHRQDEYRPFFGQHVQLEHYTCR